MPNSPPYLYSRSYPSKGTHLSYQTSRQSSSRPPHRPSLLARRLLTPFPCSASIQFMSPTVRTNNLRSAAARRDNSPPATLPPTLPHLPHFHLETAESPSDTQLIYRRRAPDAAELSHSAYSTASPSAQRPAHARLSPQSLTPSPIRASAYAPARARRTDVRRSHLRRAPASAPPPATPYDARRPDASAPLAKRPRKSALLQSRSPVPQPLPPIALPSREAAATARHPRPPARDQQPAAIGAEKKAAVHTPRGKAPPTGRRARRAARTFAAATHASRPAARWRTGGTTCPTPPLVAARRVARRGARFSHSRRVESTRSNAPAPPDTRNGKRSPKEARRLRLQRARSLLQPPLRPADNTIFKSISPAPAPPLPPASTAGAILSTQPEAEARRACNKNRTSFCQGSTMSRQRARQAHARRATTRAVRYHTVCSIA